MKARISKTLIAALCAIFLAGHLTLPAAAAITDEEFQYYLKYASARHDRRGGAEGDLATRVYSRVKIARTADEGIKIWANADGLTEEEAADVLTALYQATWYRRECRRGENKSSMDCKFGPGAAVYETLQTTGMADESGGIAIEIGKVLRSQADQLDFLGVVATHPAYRHILRRLTDSSHSQVWTFQLLQDDLNSPASAKVLSRTAMWGKANAALNLSAMEYALQTATNREAAFLYAKAVMQIELDHNLTSEALANYKGLSRRQRANFFGQASGTGFDRMGLAVTYYDFQLGSALAAAALIEGDRYLGRKLVRQMASVPSDTKKTMSIDDLHMADMVRDVVETRYTANELFDLYLHRPEEALETGDVAERRRQQRTWLATLKDHRPPVILIVAARRLSDAGLPDLAEHVVDRGIGFEHQVPEDLVRPSEKIVPAPYRARQAYWQNKFNEAWDRWDTERQQMADRRVVSALPSQIHPSDFASPFNEAPLPEPLAHATCDERDFHETEIPEEAGVPVNPYQVVRYEVANGHKSIVFVSRDLDPTGEIPAYGYWFQTTDQSGHWTDPVYLGLQKHSPYVIRPASQVPMRDGVGHLTLEVDVKEIDSETISFPPVGLDFKRDTCNVLINASMDDLTRDSDDDGITDLVEARIGLNPTNADTDGDGLRDGLDSLPLTRYNPATDRRTSELAVQILNVVAGIDRNAIMVAPGTDAPVDFASLMAKEKGDLFDPTTLFMAADPSLFSGLRLPLRVVVYSPADLDILNRKGAPFYPIRVKKIFRRPDGNEFYVIWSASWTGGEFLVSCDDNGCTTTSYSHWIT